MRLGDLDALKEKLGGENYQTWTHEYGYAIPTEWVMNAIDNAPTVFSCNACKNMCNERECVDCYDYSNYVHYEKRKQGKWKLIKDKGNNIHAECPFCKFQIKCIAYNYSIWEVRQFIKNGDYDFELPNFCENCGADMKGGVE